MVESQGDGAGARVALVLKSLFPLDSGHMGQYMSYHIAKANLHCVCYLQPKHLVDGIFYVAITKRDAKLHIPTQKDV